MVLQTLASHYRYIGKEIKEVQDTQGNAIFWELNEHKVVLKLKRPLKVAYYLRSFCPVDLWHNTKHISGDK